MRTPSQRPHRGASRLNDGQSVDDSSALLACSLPQRRRATPFSSKGWPVGAAPGRPGRCPFFVHGDTAWSLTHNLTYDEAVRYLEDRKRRGVNALIVYAPDAYGRDGVASFPPDRQGQQPFVGGDITQPNEAYWQHVDRVLAKTEEMGFLVSTGPSTSAAATTDTGAVPAERRHQGARVRPLRRPALRGAQEPDLGPRWGPRPGPRRDLVVAVKEGIEEVGPDRLHGTHWAPETDPWGPMGMRSPTFTSRTLTARWPPRPRTTRISPRSR